MVIDTTVPLWLWRWLCGGRSGEFIRIQVAFER